MQRIAIIATLMCWGTITAWASEDGWGPLQTIVITPPLLDLPLLPPIESAAAAAAAGSNHNQTDDDNGRPPSGESTHSVVYYGNPDASESDTDAESEVSTDSEESGNLFPDDGTVVVYETFAAMGIVPDQLPALGATDQITLMMNSGLNQVQDLLATHLYNHYAILTGLGLLVHHGEQLSIPIAIDDLSRVIDMIAWGLTDFVLRFSEAQMVNLIWRIQAYPELSVRNLLLRRLNVILMRTIAAQQEGNDGIIRVLNSFRSRLHVLVVTALTSSISDGSLGPDERRFLKRQLLIAMYSILRGLYAVASRMELATGAFDNIGTMSDGWLEIEIRRYITFFTTSRLPSAALLQHLRLALRLLLLTQLSSTIFAPDAQSQAEAAGTLADIERVTIAMQARLRMQNMLASIAARGVEDIPLRINLLEARLARRLAAARLTLHRVRILEAADAARKTLAEAMDDPENQ